MDVNKPEWHLDQFFTLDKPINAVAFNATDTLLALAAGCAKADVYATSDWKKTKSLTELPKHPIDSLYFTPQNELLASVLSLHTACLVNLDTQKEIISIVGGENDWVSPSCIAAGESLFAIGYYNKVDLYDLNEKNKKPVSFDMTPSDISLKDVDLIMSLDINSTNQLLAAGSLQGTIYMYDIKTKKLIFPVLKKGPASIVAFSKSGNFFVTGDINGIVDVYKIDKEKNQLQKIHCFKNPEEKTIKSLSFSPNDKLLAVGTEDCLYIHDLTNKDYFFSFPNTGLIKALAFSHCSTLLAAGSSDKVARIFASKKSSTKD